MAWTILRGGRVLDIAAGSADFADILIDRDTIREIGPPGLRGAGRCGRDFGRPPAAASGPGQRPHPRPRQSRQGDGRSLDAGIAADRRTLDHRQPHPRGPLSVDPAGRRRDGHEGLHRLLRSVVRMAVADRRRTGTGGAGLCRCRHARGGGADGRRPQLFRGDPGLDGGDAAGIAGASRRVAAAAGRSDDMRRCARHCPAGRSTATRCARRWRRRSRIIARMRSSAAAPISLASSMSHCTAMLPSRRCRR